MTLMGQDAYQWIEKALQTIHKADWHRTVTPLAGKAGAVMEWQGQPVVNFASNDYLGLAGDSRLAAAAIAAIHTYGTGSTGSRLLSGHREIHQRLERAIANWKGTEDAIVFSAGYLANLGTISALVGTRDLILSDQYNHSSLIKGSQLSGAQIKPYRHNDTTDLQIQLETVRSHYRRCLIVTDTVFSMDGDVCLLPEILDLATAFDSMVLVDEAHGTGIFGCSGSGVVEHLGCRGSDLIQMGTLSKALGSLGGYVTGKATVIDFLRNRAPTWIYTTALSPADAAAALTAVHLAQTESTRRDRLWQNVAHLERSLQSLLMMQALSVTYERLLASASPIRCLEVKDAASVMEIGQKMLEAGCLVAAVRPPTVPTSRLRMTVMATHTAAQIEQLAATLAAISP
jgi:8-amino-7-oxononanoate synthase